MNFLLTARSLSLSDCCCTLQYLPNLPKRRYYYYLLDYFVQCLCGCVMLGSVCVGRKKRMSWEARCFYYVVLGYLFLNIKTMAASNSKWSLEIEKSLFLTGARLIFDRGNSRKVTCWPSNTGVEVPHINPATPKTRSSKSIPNSYSFVVVYQNANCYCPVHTTIPSGNFGIPSALP